MGFKLRGAIRCGRCGKSRGVRHVCVTSRIRKRHHKAQNPVMWECSTCGKRRGLRHTCTIRIDFKKRKQAAARKRTTAERRKRRQITAAKRKLRRQLAAADRRARDKARKPAAKSSPRPRAESHEPGTCGNRECSKFGCKAYWQGMADCPGPHDGGG